jgi:NtrC-family two-component system response regulator AlgB
MQDRTIETAQGDKRNDLRIIAASSRDLVPEVKKHRFREDLFYNLNILSLRVPPLRERPADILPLALRMLAAAASRNRRGELHLSQEAVTAMVQYRWPGNVRELQNAMEAAAVLCRGETITLANLPEAASKHLQDIETLSSSKTSLDEMERQHILRILSRSPTLEQAAATLGIDVSTLWRKRKRYSLNVTIGSTSWRTLT